MPDIISHITLEDDTFCVCASLRLMKKANATFKIKPTDIKTGNVHLAIQEAFSPLMGVFGDVDYVLTHKQALIIRLLLW